MTGAGVGTVMVIETELPDVGADGDGEATGEGDESGAGELDGAACDGTVVGAIDGAGVGCAAP